MRRLLGILIALTLALGVPALAEEASDGLSENALTAGEAVSADLDGDGTEETVFWEEEELDEYTTQAALTVTAADGTETAWESGMLYEISAYLLDLDGDGAMEIFFSGDEMSSDYLTYCLHYAEGALELLDFPDISRIDINTDAYYNWGYGEITAIGDGTVTLTGSQDVLGTYFGSRTLALTDGQFEIADDGLWIIERDFDDSEFWDGYSILTLTADLDVTLDDGTDAVLESGTRLAITATDKSSVAYFQTEDGQTGTIAIEYNSEQGWGWLVNGTDEEELFELVPYAD